LLIQRVLLVDPVAVAAERVVGGGQAQFARARDALRIQQRAERVFLHIALQAHAQQADKRPLGELVAHAPDPELP
jgi:hypothetical protein